MILFVTYKVTNEVMITFYDCILSGRYFLRPASLESDGEMVALININRNDETFKDILVSPSKYVRFIHIDLCLFHESSVTPVTLRLCARPTALSPTR